MGENSPRITGPTLKVLGQLMASATDGIAGADISRSTGIPSGTLYPILFRLEKAAWVRSEWEDVDPAEVGRPRKRLYCLTSVGKREAKMAFDDVIPQIGRLEWQS